MAVHIEICLGRSVGKLCCSRKILFFTHWQNDEAFIFPPPRTGDVGIFPDPHRRFESEIFSLRRLDMCTYASLFAVCCCKNLRYYVQFFI